MGVLTSSFSEYTFENPVSIKRDLVDTARAAHVNDLQIAVNDIAKLLRKTTDLTNIIWTADVVGVLSSRSVSMQTAIQELCAAFSDSGVESLSFVALADGYTISGGDVPRSLTVKNGNAVLDMLGSGTKTLFMSGDAVFSGTKTTITGADQDNTLTLRESLTVGDGEAGTLTFENAGKTLTVGASLTVTGADFAQLYMTNDLTVGGGNNTTINSTTEDKTLLLSGAATSINIDAPGNYTLGLTGNAYIDQDLRTTSTVAALRTLNINAAAGNQELLILNTQSSGSTIRQFFKDPFTSKRFELAVTPGTDGVDGLFILQSAATSILFITSKGLTGLKKSTPGVLATGGSFITTPSNPDETIFHMYAPTTDGFLIIESNHPHIVFSDWASPLDTKNLDIEFDANILRFRSLNDDATIKTDNIFTLNSETFAANFLGTVTANSFSGSIDAESIDTGNLSMSVMPTGGIWQSSEDHIIIAGPNNFGVRSTTSPSEKLEVGDGTSRGALVVIGDSQASGMAGSYVRLRDDWGGGSNELGISIYDGTAETILLDGLTGRIGLNKTSPTFNLDIISSSTDGFRLTRSATNGNLQFGMSGNNALIGAAGFISQMTIHYQAPNSSLVIGATGLITAGVGLAGPGSGITSINAGNISSGNLNIARMPSGGVWTTPSVLTIDNTVGSGHIIEFNSNGSDGAFIRLTDQGSQAWYMGVANGTGNLEFRPASIVTAAILTLDDTAGTSRVVLTAPDGDEAMLGIKTNTADGIVRQRFESSTSKKFEFVMDFDDSGSNSLFKITTTAGTALSIHDTKKIGIGADPLTNMAAGDLLLEGGSLVLKEITTPTADANYGKIYTKSDDKLYFQDGAGTEHEIAFV